MLLRAILEYDGAKCDVWTTFLSITHSSLFSNSCDTMHYLNLHTVSVGSFRGVKCNIRPMAPMAVLVKFFMAIAAGNEWTDTMDICIFTEMAESRLQSEFGTVRKNRYTKWSFKTEITSFKRYLKLVLKSQKRRIFNDPSRVYPQ